MRVSIVRCDSYENNEVRKALESSLKNLDFKFKKNLKVLIKPNILSPHPPEKAITTHPTILGELCKILQKHNAKIYIGESSSYDTKQAFRISKIGELKKYAEIINFETHEKEFANFKTIKKVLLPRILSEVDLIINVPKLKTHTFTGLTLCVKNLYGCIPGKIKSSYHKILRSPGNFSKFLLELHERIKPSLNIIDGVIGLEGMGPATAGKPVKSKVIISGDNAIATDIIASEILGFNPYSIYSNKLAGVEKSKIEIVGEPIKIAFEKPPSSLSFTTPFFHFLNNIFPKPKIFFDHSKCTKCRLCENNCPVKAIELAPFPECKHKKCIRCACCVEVCPNSAVTLKEDLTKRTARKLYKKLLKNQS